MKKWYEPVGTVRHVMIVTDELPGDADLLSIKLERHKAPLSADQQIRLDNLLVLFGQVLTDVPGKTDLAEITIDTGEHKLPASMRIPLQWREGVDRELQKLLSLGIIGPSQSPWSILSLVLERMKVG